MSTDVQAVIQAIIRAAEEPAPEAGRPRVPVITVSRMIGCGGQEVAQKVADRLGVGCYGQEILDAIAKGADVSQSLLRNLIEKVNRPADAWLYSAVFGKRVSKDEYMQRLVSIVRGLYNTGGVILGRGAHLVLSGRDVLRVRLVGSFDACARRVAEEDGSSFADANRKVRESTIRRGRFIWEMFNARQNDPTNFDIVVNTDHFTNMDDVVDLIIDAGRGIGVITDDHLKVDKQAKTAGG